MYKTQNRNFLVGSLLVLTVLLGCAMSSFGCSMAKLPEWPRAFVPRDEYILIGKVVGYTRPVSDPDNFRGSAVGVKLKILVPIQVPNSLDGQVELFIFGHGTDCFPEAGSEPPAIGTTYRLVLSPARLVASSSGSMPRLESRVFDRLAINEEMFGYSTTAESEFDYKNDLRPLAKKFMDPKMADKRNWLDDFLYIEASKDLIRLKNAIIRGDEEARMKLLERLLYCPGIDYTKLLGLRRENLALQENTSSTAFALLFGIAPNVKGLSKKEKELYEERRSLETSGKLNIWQR